MEGADHKWQRLAVPTHTTDEPKGEDQARRQGRAREPRRGPTGIRCQARAGAPQWEA